MKEQSIKGKKQSRILKEMRIKKNSKLKNRKLKKRSKWTVVFLTCPTPTARIRCPSPGPGVILLLCSARMDRQQNQNRYRNNFHGKKVLFETNTNLTLKMFQTFWHCALLIKIIRFFFFGFSNERTSRRKSLLQFFIVSMYVAGFLRDYDMFTRQSVRIYNNVRIIDQPCATMTKRGILYF